MSDTTIPAAACPRCGGWTNTGGMSQHSDSQELVLDRTGCLCGKINRLEAQLGRFEVAMSELRSRGTSASMDCREMRVCESNSGHIRQELRSIRETISNQTPVRV